MADYDNIMIMYGYGMVGYGMVGGYEILYLIMIV